MSRIPFAVLCFALLSGCDRGAHTAATPAEARPAPPAPPEPQATEEKTVDVEADIAAFLTPTPNPRKRGPFIRPHEDNPEVKISVGGKLVDPNAVDPCPTGGMSRLGQTREDLLREHGPEAAQKLAETGAFDIPPDRPECAETRKQLAEARRRHLELEQQRRRAR